ncbi:MAG: hypothetical protein AAB116_15305 [Candidatus Poribacteria bacterium]
MKTTRLVIVFVCLISISLVLTGQSFAKVDPKTVVAVWLLNGID